MQTISTVSPSRTTHLPAFSPLPEKSRAVRARPSDRELSALVKETRRPLASIAARRFGLNAADSEDILQELWIRCLEQYASIEQLRPWLFGTFINLCRQRIQKRVRAREVDIAGCELDLPVVAPDANDDVLAVRQALSVVDDRTRILCELIAMEEWSYRDVADKLALPIGSVGPLYMRAKARVREALMFRPN